jgi:hypothetical protein
MRLVLELEPEEVLRATYHEDVVGSGHIAARLKQLHQVMKLPVDVPTHLHRTRTPVHSTLHPGMRQKQFAASS